MLKQQSKEIAKKEHPKVDSVLFYVLHRLSDSSCYWTKVQLVLREIIKMFADSKRESGKTSNAHSADIRAHRVEKK